MAEAKKKATTKKEKVEAEVIVEATPVKEPVDGTTKEDVSVTSETSSEDKEVKTEVKTAKAGKRSAKAIKEAEEKEAKEERKASGEEHEDKPKAPVKPARSRLERRGKKFRKAAEQVDASKEYTLKEALELAVKTSTTKFDSTVELHVNLGVDPRQADQNIRGTVSLPAGTGKTIRVAVFADVDDAKKAKAAGADVAGSDEFLQQLDKEVIDFDVLIATPAMMAKLGKYARLLGPKGLMPNPKSGTVSNDVAKAVKEAKAGKVEYRVDTTGIVHLGVGKASFSNSDLLTNTQAILSALKNAKPTGLKGNYVKAIYLTTTMGPSVKVAVSEFQYAIIDSMKTIEGGLVVAFDGPDGVGKTTQIAQTAKYLNELGYDVHTTSFSGGTPIGKLLRKVSLSDTPRVAETDLHISLAMGFDLAADLKARRRLGQICLVDRSPLTVIAYNTFGSQLKDPETGYKAADIMFDEWRIDQLIFLNARQSVLTERLKKRTDKPVDYYESQGDDYHARVRSGYETGLAHAKQHIDILISEVDAGQSAEAIQQQIRDILPIEER